VFPGLDGERIELGLHRLGDPFAAPGPVAADLYLGGVFGVETGDARRVAGEKGGRPLFFPGLDGVTERGGLCREAHGTEAEGKHRSERERAEKWLHRTPPYFGRQESMSAYPAGRAGRPNETAHQLRAECLPIRTAYFPATSRSKRGLPLSGANVGSIRSPPGER